MSESCVDCKFWDYDEDLSDPPEAHPMLRSSYGLCRRFPPTVHPIAHVRSDEEAIFPVTEANNWCGEWKACAKD